VTNQPARTCLLDATDVVSEYLPKCTVKNSQQAAGSLQASYHSRRYAKAHGGVRAVLDWHMHEKGGAQRAGATAVIAHWKFEVGDHW
jgi:hypothetical protein